jgi:hypothetical protein
LPLKGRVDGCDSPRNGADDGASQRPSASAGLNTVSRRDAFEDAGSVRRNAPSGSCRGQRVEAGHSDWRSGKKQDPRRDAFAGLTRPGQTKALFRLPEGTSLDQPQFLHLVADLVPVPAKEARSLSHVRPSETSFVRSLMSISDQGSPEFASTIYLATRYVRHECRTTVPVPRTTGPEPQGQGGSVSLVS